MIVSTAEASRPLRDSAPLSAAAARSKWSRGLSVPPLVTPSARVPPPHRQNGVRAPSRKMMSLAMMSPQDGRDLHVHFTIRGERLLAEVSEAGPRPAVEIRHAAARLPDDEQPRGDVPRTEPELPKPVPPPRRDPAHVERGGAAAPDVVAARHEVAEKLDIEARAFRAVVRKAGDQQRLGEPRGPGDGELPAVEARAAAGLREEGLVARGVVDAGDERRAVLEQRDARA